MIGKIKDGLKQRYISSWLIYKVLNYRYKSLSQLCEERKGRSIFDYRDLSKDLPLGISHPIIDNSLYGLKEALCKYARIANVNHKIFFEHGLIFGSLVQKQARNSFAQKILTFSDYRERYISKWNRGVIKIGPYIHYVDNLINNEDWHSIKGEIGRTLLIFPSHSIKGLKIEFDHKAFLNHIKLLQSDFDTVMVCLYWKDIQLGKAQPYVDAGYKIVTAGHFRDLYFLPRLKTIISLGDVTMSNDIGTHIGYCIYMCKPHYIYNQEIQVESLDKTRMKNELAQWSTNDREEYRGIKNKLLSVFNDFGYTITDAQHDLVSYIWGFEHIKSQQQMKNALI